MVAFEAMKINFSIKRATGIENDFGLFDKFNTMLISWFLNDETLFLKKLNLF